MKRALQVFEGAIITVLVAMMALAIAAATVDVLWLFLTDLPNSPFDFRTVPGLLELFGVFMIVLIGLELMDTVKTYITDKRIRVEAV